ncbi:hypothetical protein LTR04_002939, partial [Oleoguttula sp. CCFEE 6159]
GDGGCDGLIATGLKSDTADMKDSAELEDDDVVDEDDDVDSAESERSRSFVGRRQVSLNGDSENLDDEVTGDARGAGVGVSAMKARKDLGGEG